MESLWKDIRHSLRMFRKSPSFTLTAVAALGFGIGANTAIFSVVNAVLFKPLALPDADRVVFMMNTRPQGSGPAASPAKFAFWKKQTDVIRDVSVFRDSVMNYTGGDVPAQLHTQQVSADYFRLVGATLDRGRSFAAEEDLPNGSKVVVLSHGLWQRRFGGGEVLGKSISLSGESYTVVGVMSAGFDAGDLADPPPEAWVPFQLNPASTDQGHYFRAAARLAPGVTVAQAQARVQASAAEFGARFPNAMPPGSGFSVERVHDVLVRNVKRTLLVLLCAVLFVLLIACANVANLLLVRASSRRREIAIRFALGAGRGRIMRQLLTESVILALLGGALGLALGIFGIHALLAVNTADLPRVGEGGALVGVDWRVVGFTIAVSIVTGLIFGLVPAWHGSRADLGATLKEGGRTGSGGGHNRARSVLVVAEIALALVLLVGSALLIRTTMALHAVNPGFDSKNVLTMSMSLNGERYKKTEAVERVLRDGLARIRALPGVEEASAACCIPLEGGYGLPFTIVGRPTEKGPYHGGGGWLTVSPGYFEVFKIAARRGRTFNDRDVAGGAPVAVINEAMAREFWKDGDPIGAHLAIGRGVMHEFAGEPDREIVGVVSDVRDGGLNNEPNPTMYIPQGQVPDDVNGLNLGISPMKWLVRTKIAPRSLIGPVEEQLRIATGLPVAEMRPMVDVVSRSTSRERFHMLVMTIFGAAALLLAAIGIYGLMSYTVEQRTQEIGIRLALGADSGVVRRMVVRQGMVLSAIGIVVGVAASFGLTRFISGFLFGVKAWDPVVFVSIPLLLAAVAFVAVWRPAWRASRVDPMSALRAE